MRDQSLRVTAICSHSVGAAMVVFLFAALLSARATVTTEDSVPEFEDIRLRLFVKDCADLGLITRLGAEDFDEYGALPDSYDLSAIEGSLVIGRGLDRVVLHDDLDLEGVLIVADNTDCEVWGDVDAVMGIASLANLTVFGSILTAGDIAVHSLCAGGNVLAGGQVDVDVLQVGGDLCCASLTTAGDLVVEGSVQCEHWMFCEDDVYVKGDVSAVGSIQAYGNATVGSICSEDMIFVAWGALRAEGDVRCRGDCTAGIGIYAGGDIEVGGEIITGCNPPLFGSLQLEKDKPTITCARLVDGDVVLGEVEESARP